MTKCPTCRAKIRQLWYFRGKMLCHDCLCEYRQVFEGWQSKRTLRALAHKILLDSGTSLDAS